MPDLLIIFNFLCPSASFATLGLPQMPLFLAEAAETAVEAASEAEGEVAPLVLAGVLLSLIVVFLASKVGGEICARINLPPVLGELVGGVIVGVSALHLLVFPESGATAADSVIIQILQQTAGLQPSQAAEVFSAQSEVISVLAEMGVILLLFEIGLESDLKELIKVGPQAAIVAVVGVVTPFALGTLGLLAFFQMALVPAIFAGAALTATSIGITAKVLSELRQLSSKEGQIIIGAAILDDILGIVVLAVVASLAKTGEVKLSNVAILIFSAAAFLIGTIVIGRLLAPYFISVVKELKTRGQLLIAAMIVTLILAYVGAIIHLEAILGAFAAGLILGETEKRHELEEQVVPIADVLVPVFFISVGAKTALAVLDPTVPSNREGLIIAAFLVTVAIIGKIVTGYALVGKSDVNKFAIGVGMIPRGEVGLVFAGVGAASGALSDSLNAAVIVMVIATTFVAPPLLRVAFNMGGGDEAAPAVAAAEAEES